MTSSSKRKKKRKNEVEPCTMGGRDRFCSVGRRNGSKCFPRDPATGAGPESRPARGHGHSCRWGISTHRWSDRLSSQCEDQVDPQLYVAQGGTIPLCAGEHGGRLRPVGRERRQEERGQNCKFVGRAEGI